MTNSAIFRRRDFLPLVIIFLLHTQLFFIRKKKTEYCSHQHAYIINTYGHIIRLHLGILTYDEKNVISAFDLNTRRTSLAMLPISRQYGYRVQLKILTKLST